KQDAALDAVTGRRALESIYQVMQRDILPIHGIAAVVVRVVEKAIVRMFLAAGFGYVDAVRQDHVVQPLISGSRDLGPLANNVEVLGERPHPILAAELFAVL